MEQHTSNNLVDYAALILGFSSAALGYLGYMPLEEGGKIEKNLNLAKYNIDIIAMLKEKTSGNLTQEEAVLTDNVLTDLRMKFVEQSK